MERVHAVLRWRRVRFRRRDRHRHRTHPCPRPGGARATDHLPLSGDRHRAGASLNTWREPIPRFGDRRRMRIGLLGGSFNPAHAGHRHIVDLARRRLRLDQVWLLVSPGNPLKPQRGMASFDQRLASARNIADGRRVIVSAIEAVFGTRYTIDTLRRLLCRFPRVCFVWLMGADILEELPRWRRWLEFVRRVRFAVLPRPGYNRRALSGHAARRLAHARRPARSAAALCNSAVPAWVFLCVPQHVASATAIRASEGAKP